MAQNKKVFKTIEIEIEIDIPEDHVGFDIDKAEGDLIDMIEEGWDLPVKGISITLLT